MKRVPRSAGTDADLLRAEADLAALEKQLAWEMSKAAVDVAGLVDPTPISDAVGMGMSLADGDLIGAGLSLISMVPYAGDALGKTAKGARAAKKLNQLRKQIAAAVTKVRALKKAKAAKPAAKKAVKGAGKAPKSSGPCIPCQKKSRSLPKKGITRGPIQKKSKLKAARRRAVDQAWKQEREMVMRTGEGTRSWTDKELSELIQEKKVKGYDGHHINNVHHHPELADSPDNIEFLTRSEHLKAHKGNWHNKTTGRLLKRR